MLWERADLYFILIYPHRRLGRLVDKEGTAPDRSTPEHDIFIIAPHQIYGDWYALFDSCLATYRVVAIWAHSFEIND